MPRMNLRGRQISGSARCTHGRTTPTSIMTLWTCVSDAQSIAEALRFIIVDASTSKQMSSLRQAFTSPDRRLPASECPTTAPYLCVLGQLGELANQRVVHLLWFPLEHPATLTHWSLSSRLDCCCRKQCHVRDVAHLPQPAMKRVSPVNASRFPPDSQTYVIWPSV